MRRRPAGRREPVDDANVSVAKEIIGRYPRPKSALIPLLHLAQEQDGYITDEAMRHIAELVGHTPAEVYGTATFYEMFKFEPVGRYCSTSAAHLVPAARRRGADATRRAAPRHQGRGTTDDGVFTLEHAECHAACTEAPACR